MIRPAREYVVMMSLGLLSIFAVLGVGQLFKKSGSERPDSQSRLLGKAVDELKDSSEAQGRETAKRLSEIESALRDIEQRLATTEAIVSHLPALPSSTSPPLDEPRAGLNRMTGSGRVQAALSRGWQYVAKNEFAPENHDRVLSDLVAAYAVQGLSTEENSALVAAIQQVNEIGVGRVIRESEGLSAIEAANRLRTFLQTTPKLTPGQRTRINSAIAKHSVSGRPERGQG